MSPGSLFKKNRLLVLSSVLVLGGALALGYWLFKPANLSVNNNPFAKYIDSYTSGTISKQGTVRIRFASDIPIIHSRSAEENVFDFSPAIKGKAYWLDSRTLEFKPEEDLKPGKGYSGELNMRKLIEVPKELEKFPFNFQIIESAFKV